MGFEADIKAMPEAYDYSMAFFRRFYRPENVVLHDRRRHRPGGQGLAAKYYGDWKPGYEPAQIPPEPPQKATPGRGRISRPDAADSGPPTRATPSTRTTALYVAAELLAELAFGATEPRCTASWCSTGRRRKRFSADVPLAATPAIRDHGHGQERGGMDAVAAGDRPHIEQFQTQPVDAAKLAQVKRHEKYALLMAMDSPAAVAGGWRRLWAPRGGIETLDRLYAEADQVTPEDVLQAARKYFNRNRRTVAVLKGTQQ